MCYIKKHVLKNFTKFTGKYLCQSFQKIKYFLKPYEIFYQNLKKYFDPRNWCAPFSYPKRSFLRQKQSFSMVLADFFMAYS